jgi:phospholipase C
MADGDLLPGIDHVVVLMLENRSFDHMLGYLYADQGNKSPSGQPFDGLTGQESNTDKNGVTVPVFRIAATDPNPYFMPGADPGEGYAATNNQLFGSITAPTPPVASNGGFVKDFAYTLGWQQGSKGWTVLPGTTEKNIMGMFTPEMLPILSGLARGYAVCDRWFCSAPTETLPNRAFACAGTSQGHTDDKTAHTFTCPSIFGLLDKHGCGWSIYGYDAVPLTRLNFPDTTNAPSSHFGVFTDFQAAAAKGSLPPYTFLEPKFRTGGNDQHPVNDVALGEQLIHDVYYAVHDGPAWARTMLIVTYDEHGGCYDHVAPPTGAVPPDNSIGEHGFDFKRFGVRVPAVIVSPLIAAGTVFRAPDGGPPIDHTSILRTVEKRWGLPALSARDAAAPDLGAVLTLARARSDDPLQGVKVPISGKAVPNAEVPSHLQQVKASLVSQLLVPDPAGGSERQLPEARTTTAYEDYIRSRTAAWEASRTTPGSP